MIDYNCQSLAEKRLGKWTPSDDYDTDWIQVLMSWQFKISKARSGPESVFQIVTGPSVSLQ